MESFDKFKKHSIYNYSKSLNKRYKNKLKKEYKAKNHKLDNITHSLIDKISKKIDKENFLKFNLRFVRMILKEVEPVGLNIETMWNRLILVRKLHNDYEYLSSFIVSLNKQIENYELAKKTTNYIGYLDDNNQRKRDLLFTCQKLKLKMELDKDLNNNHVNNTNKKNKI